MTYDLFSSIPHGGLVNPTTLALYTGTAIPIDNWRSRMWLDTWV
ncbi:hypothetical protein [Streptomyces sp. MAI_2237]